MMAIGAASVREPRNNGKDNQSPALLKLAVLLLIIELSVLAFALVKLHDLQAELADIKTGSQAGSGSECHQNSYSKKRNEWTGHCNSEQDSNARNGTMFSSCNDALRRLPAAPSGHYLVKGTYGYPIHVYCDMTLKCRGVSGGWRKIVLWNLSEPGTTCLSGLTHTEDPSSCIQSNEESRGCTSVKFENLGIPYTSVCGRINALHSRSLDAFMKYSLSRPENLTVEHNYVDGVSLTHGPVGERVHIWSFAASICQLGSQDKPDFVKDHFSSDDGSLTDPLWDDNQCPGTPCSKSSWFFRNLTEGTYSDLEIRVCRDQGRHDEDVLLTYVELYAQ